MMKEKTEELLELCDEVMAFCCKETMSTNCMKNATVEDFKAWQLILKLVDKSKDLAIAQAEMIDETNNKIDRLIKLVEKQKQV